MKWLLLIFLVGCGPMPIKQPTATLPPHQPQPQVPQVCSANIANACALMEPTR